MKRGILLLVGLLLLVGGAAPVFCQEQKTAPQREELLDLKSKLPTYDPAGRRDPFKNLLSGKEIKEKTPVGGVPQLFIDDVNLIGIVRFKKKYTAVLSGPQGFPYYFEVGDKLSDGFILTINETQVIFRKTNERGIPLTKPKDIIKEINPEER